MSVAARVSQEMGVKLGHEVISFLFQTRYRFRPFNIDDTVHSGLLLLQSYLIRLGILSDLKIALRTRPS